MDRTIRTAALRALVNAERDAKERYSRQMREAKSILYGFIRRYGKLNISAEIQENATIVEAARSTVEIAAHVINQMKLQLETTDLDALKTENARLKEELEALKKATVHPAVAPHSETLIAPAVESPGADVPDIVAALVPVEVTPLSDGSLEDQILNIAGAAHILLVPNLVTLCAEKLNTDRATIEAGLDNLVKSGHIEIHKATRPSKTGDEYAPAFSLPLQGSEVLRQKGLTPANVGRRLWGTDQFFPEELPLFGYFTEEVLPDHGYVLTQYLPAINRDREYSLVPHALLQKNGTPIYLMFVGEKYGPKGISGPYQFLRSLTRGEMYFIGLTPRLAKTIQSDIAYLTSGKTDPVPNLHISNVEDLAAYEELVTSGQIKQTAETVWFGSMRNKRLGG